jgi:hypothetical protein
MMTNEEEVAQNGGMRIHAIVSQNSAFSTYFLKSA